jgi:hypothetical protein
MIRFANMCKPKINALSSLPIFCDPLEQYGWRRCRRCARVICGQSSSQQLDLGEVT